MMSLVGISPLGRGTLKVSLSYTGPYVAKNESWFLILRNCCWMWLMSPAIVNVVKHRRRKSVRVSDESLSPQ